MIAHLADFEQVLDTVWWIYTKSMNIKVCTIIAFYNILWISTKLIMVVIYSLNVFPNLLYYLQWLSPEPHRQVKHPLSASVAANYTSAAELPSYLQPPAKHRRRVWDEVSLVSLVMPCGFVYSSWAWGWWIEEIGLHWLRIWVWDHQFYENFNPQLNSNFVPGDS